MSLSVGNLKIHIIFGFFNISFEKVPFKEEKEDQIHTRND
jgi:hypothetical protein